MSLEERRQAEAKVKVTWVFLHISESLKRECGHFRWTEKERKFRWERRVRYADDFMWNPPEASALGVKQIPKQKSRTEPGGGVSERQGAGQQRWWSTPQKRKDADRDVSGEVSPKQWGNDMRQMGLSRVSTRGTGKLCECEASRVWSPVKWDDSSPFLLRDEQKQEEAIFSGEKAMLGKQAVFRKKKRLPSNKDRCLSRGFPFLNRRNLRNSSPLKYDQRCVLVLRVHVSRCLYTCMSR